jgi:polyisoprenoid-binding protein YceI
MTPTDGPASSKSSFLNDGSTSGAWKLDSSRSTVHFKSKSMWGLVPVKGGFSALEGDVRVEPDGAVSGKISVATSSVNTGNKKRDTHLRSKDFFDSDVFPAITFRLTGVSAKGSQLDVAGELTVGSTTRAISFPATVAVAKDRSIDVTAETVIDRSDFGLTWNQLGASSMKNHMTVHAVFERVR